MEQRYAQYAVEKAVQLLAIDSPTGFTDKAAEWVLEAFASLGFDARKTTKGGILIDLGGEESAEGGLLLQAHTDTLGAMVAEVKANGRLRVTNLGGMRAENGETENVRVYTRGGKVYEGTLQLCNASVHVNGDYGKTERTFDTTEVLLDEAVTSADETRALGIETGDIVCFDPRTRVTASGYIKSRFLDDKLSVGILLGYWHLRRRTRALPLRDQAELELAYLFGMVGTFVGAKLLSLLTVLPELRADLPLLTSDIGAFFRKYLYAGFVFYGGLYGILSAVWLYAKLAGCQFALLARAYLPIVPLIHGFGRLGCFCVGCCYGKPSERLGIAFAHSEIAPNGVPLLPVQLIEAALVFGLFFLLWQMSRRGMDGRRMLGWYLLVYSVGRFVLEFFRGDTYRGFIGILSVSQVIALLSILGGGLLLWRTRAPRNA